MPLNDVIEILTSSWTTIISLGFFSFVVILFVAKVYVKIRSRFNVLVNCWFCNQNTRVQYADYNSWNCPNCGQYNGFTDDGDYNKEISDHIRNTNVQFSQRANENGVDHRENGLCHMCNDNQLIKIEKLAGFEPEKERTFDVELKKFRESLEDTYRLCPRCEKKLQKVLAEKKKMVLGLHLAHKCPTKTRNQTTNFIKPLHIKPSKSLEIVKFCINSILFISAIINWIHIISELKLNRETLTTTFGPIIASIFFFSISHLAAFTKVILKYLSAILNVQLIEKTLLFIRTVVFLIAYTKGIDLYKQISIFNGNGLFESVVPFGSMFLTFGAQWIDGFSVTRKTYLLALWSAYSFSLKMDISPEFNVFKVFTSLTIVLLSMPALPKKQHELQNLLNGMSSFHRIQSEDYLSDPNSSKSINKNLSSSFNSSRSSGSYSPVSLSTYRNTTLTSSALNLCTTPSSAFKTYSTDNLHNRGNQVFNNSLTFSPISQSLSTNIANQNIVETPSRVRSPLHVDADLNGSFSECLTPRTFVSCPTSFTSRRSLLSPSHFAGANNTICFTAHVSPAQSPCPSNNVVYSNFDDNIEKQKKYLFSNVIPHESVSRGSSQSSGFESIASSTIQPPSDRFYTHEKSYGHHNDELFTSYADQSRNFDSASMMSHKQYKMPAPQSSFANNRSNIFQSKVMDFETEDHWIRNTPRHRRQVFNADIWSPPNKHMGTPNAFDLNGMNSYLPAIRKRYNLLGNLNENGEKLYINSVDKPFKL